MSSNTALKTAVAAAALATLAGADAWRLDFFQSGDCSGSAVSGYGTASSCLATGSDGQSSFNVTCDSESSSSAWNYYVFDGTSCSGAVTGTFGGSNADDCVAVSTVSYKVDCGAQACFSAASEVTLEGGATVPMSQLNPGDRVLSADEEGNLFFDKVFRVTHWDQDGFAGYVRIKTDDDHVLELTPNHYVHSGGLGAASLKPAGEVLAGDELFVVGQDGRTTSATVVSAEAVTGKGLFNVHTLSGRIVVNGVVSSHFSSDTTWSDDQKFSTAPYWYKAVDLVTSLFGNAKNARLEK